MRPRALIPSIALMLAATPMAQAHPHVFVDSTMRVFVQDGQAVSVELTWTYDDFFSLLILEDMGLDPDGDGVLSEAELAQLKGFDFVEWPPGFEGDLYVYQGGEKLPLGIPEVTGIALEEGRIVSRHIRPLPPQTQARGLEILQYDPTYYVAYTLDSQVRALGGACMVGLAPHDPDQALAEIDAELSTLPDDVVEEMRVGHLFADKVMVTCASGS
jgi:polyphosphate kinase